MRIKTSGSLIPDLEFVAFYADSLHDTITYPLRTNGRRYKYTVSYQNRDSMTPDSLRFTFIDTMMRFDSLKIDTVFFTRTYNGINNPITDDMANSLQLFKDSIAPNDYMHAIDKKTDKERHRVPSIELFKVKKVDDE